MAAERPEKQTIRVLWAEEVRRSKSAGGADDVPLYLTLPGTKGGDILTLANEGIIELAENGAVADPDLMQLVAVESSAGAVIELQRRFPGLKILQESIGNLLHSTSPFSWPTGETRRFFRAQVVNLDLNEPLIARIDNDQLNFPVLRWVHKVAQLHAAPPHIDWTLCLTLHGEVSWTKKSDQLACQFLAENFSRNPDFSEHARAVLGDDLHDAICTRPTRVGIRDLAPDTQQRVLMVLVPKQIAFDAHSDGWCIDTVENLRYGGRGSRAPMVTWVLRFSWDDRARSQPDTLYREALARCLLRQGSIDSEGVLRRG